MRRSFSFCLFLSTMYINSFGQNNYFYGSVEVPIADYIVFLTDNNKADNSKTDGAMFSFGYGFELKDNFWMETGLQAFVANPIYKRYYQGNSMTYDEILGKNKAFFVQASPFYKVEFNESDYLRIGTSFNFGKLFTEATFYKNGSTLQSTENSKSDFLVTVTPFIGAVFFMNKNLALGFDLEYVNVNWQKSMQHLNFSPAVQLPNQKTSNVFLSGRIIFK